MRINLISQSQSATEFIKVHRYSTNKLPLKATLLPEVGIAQYIYAPTKVSHTHRWGAPLKFRSSIVCDTNQKSNHIPEQAAFCSNEFHYFHSFFFFFFSPCTCKTFYRPEKVDAVVVSWNGILEFGGTSFLFILKRIQCIKVQ